MDVVILSLSVGLGLHQKIGAKHFVPIYFGVTNVLPILLTLFLHVDRLEEYRKHYHEVINIDRHMEEENFDFIVVGGGAGGSVVANRLSRHYKVLLIERGGNPNPLTYVPGLDTTLVSRPEHDYMFYTTPQNSSCLSCVEKRSLWNQGLGLGGSGMLNSMVYLRGHKYDYDRWAFHTGDKRWKYKNVLPYFLRSEDYCFDCEKVTSFKTPTNEKYHGYGGELPLMKPRYVPLLLEFLSAASWAHVKIRDQNAPYYYSAANVAVFNHKNSRRWSAYTSFVEPILKRPDLTIWRYTQVIQVLFHPNSNTAHGVKYERFGKIGTVSATKEIIISSGAVNTPKILLQSGIGPAHHLKQLKIPVRLDLPVGENLQDHVGTLVGPILVNERSLIFERDVNYYSALQFLFNGTGPLTLPFPTANAFWSSGRAISAGESEWPDIQCGFSSQGVSAGLAAGLARGFNVREDILNEYLDPVVGSDAFFLIIDYGRPKSRGTVRLRSTDYSDDPVIDPKYYEDNDGEDISVTVEAIQKALYIAENAPAFQKIGARLSPVPFPSCKDLKFRSASYFKCLARHFTLTFHHYVGTASMGADHDLNAVVDSELRVIGTKRLRVIDSSVMPYVTTANTHGPTIMIGERGSDFILEHWQNKDSMKAKLRHHHYYPKSKPKRADLTMGWDDPKTWFINSRKH